MEKLTPSFSGRKDRFFVQKFIGENATFFERENAATNSRIKINFIGGKFCK
mgnify:FL=1